MILLSVCEDEAKMKESFVSTQYLVIYSVRRVYWSLTRYYELYDKFVEDLFGRIFDKRYFDCTTF